MKKLSLSGAIIEALAIIVSPLWKTTKQASTTLPRHTLPKSSNPTQDAAWWRNLPPQKQTWRSELTGTDSGFYSKKELPKREPLWRNKQVTESILKKLPQRPKQEKPKIEPTQRPIRIRDFPEDSKPMNVKVEKDPNSGNLTLTSVYRQDWVDLIRSLPFRRWDPHSQTWTIKGTDFPGVIETATSSCPGLEFTYDEDTEAYLKEVFTLHFRARELQTNVDDTLHDIGLKLPLRGYQVACVEFLVLKKRALCGDQMGCVEGDSIVHVNRAGRGFKTTIKSLHERITGQTGRWDLSIPTYIRSLVNGELRLNKIERTISKGTMSTLKITLVDGKSIIVTPDHEIARPDGSWTSAEDLKSGDTVLTNGALKCTVCGSTENKIITYARAKFRGTCTKCMYRKLRRNSTFKTGKSIDKDGYVRVSGQQDHPRANRSGQVYEHILVKEKELGRYIDRSEIVHHKDENKEHNDPKNLALIASNSEHTKQHGVDGGYKKLSGSKGFRGGEIWFVPVETKIATIEPYGQLEVYDIVCADPHRNFVANGIIVHNSGKTIEMMAAALELKKRGEIRNCLIICPSTLKYIWLREIGKFWDEVNMDTGAGEQTVVIQGTPVERQVRFQEARNKFFTIINYDLIRAKEVKEPVRDENGILVPGAKPKKVLELSPDLKEAMSIGYDCVIFDEAHYVKNYNTGQTRGVKAITTGARAVWGGTGTPLMNRLEDLHSITTMIDPTFFPWHGKFVEAYFDPLTGEPDPKKMPQLHKRVKDIMIRRLKKDILKDLPPKVPQTEYVELTKEQRQLYDETLDKAKVFLGNSIADGTPSYLIVRGILAQMMRLKQICVHPGLLGRTELTMRAGASGKITRLKELLENDLAGEKVVIFSQFEKLIQFLKKELHKYNPLSITGNRTLDGGPKERAYKEQLFQEDDSRKLMLLTTAGGLGLTLTASSQIILLDSLWNPQIMDQIEDRLHRYGQKDAVFAMTMFCEQTIEERIWKTLKKKKDLFARAVEGQEVVLSDDEAEKNISIKDIQEWLEPEYVSKDIKGETKKLEEATI